MTMDLEGTPITSLGFAGQVDSVPMMQQPIQIPQLASQINAELDEFSQDSIPMPDDQIEEEPKPIKRKPKIRNVRKEKQSHWLTSWFDWRELVILLALYFVMSTTSVYSTVGKYIPIIKPNADGSIASAGILVYGILLVALFILIRRFVRYTTHS